MNEVQYHIPISQIEKDTIHTQPQQETPSPSRFKKFVFAIGLIATIAVIAAHCLKNAAETTPPVRDPNVAPNLSPTMPQPSKENDLGLGFVTIPKDALPYSLERVSGPQDFPLRAGFDKARLGLQMAWDTVRNEQDKRLKKYPDITEDAMYAKLQSGNWSILLGSGSHSFLYQGPLCAALACGSGELIKFDPQTKAIEAIYKGVFNGGFPHGEGTHMTPKETFKGRFVRGERVAV